MFFSGIAGACVLTLIGFVCGQAYGHGFFLRNAAKPPDSKRHPVRRSNFDANEHLRPDQLHPKKTGWSLNRTAALSIRQGSILPREALQSLPQINQGGLHRLGLQGTTDQVFTAAPDLMVPRRGPPIPSIDLGPAPTEAAITAFPTTLEAIGKKRMALPIGDPERSRQEGTSHNLVQEDFRTQFNRDVIYVPGNVELVPSTRVLDNRPLPFFSDQ